MTIMSLIKHQIFEMNFRVSRPLTLTYMIKNHNNGGSEYRHATKNDFYSNLYFQIFDPYLRFVSHFYIMWRIASYIIAFIRSHCKVIVEIALKLSFGLSKTGHILQERVNGPLVLAPRLHFYMLNPAEHIISS